MPAGSFYNRGKKLMSESKEIKESCTSRSATLILEIKSSFTCGESNLY